jgi:uncharacterized protein RhaS with RHS repeats
MYFRARHYDVALGQFIQRDPIGFAAGDLNLYAYTWNDPYNWTDPSGLASSRNAGKFTVGVTAMAIRAATQMSAGAGSLAMNIRNALAAMAIIGVLANTEGDDADEDTPRRTGDNGGPPLDDDEPEPDKPPVPFLPGYDDPYGDPDSWGESTGHPREDVKPNTTEPVDRRVGWVILVIRVLRIVGGAF